MPISRRKFMIGIFPAAAAGGLFLEQAQAKAGEEEVSRQPAERVFKVYPVGKVEKKDGKTCIRIFEKYADALLGLDGWSHVDVFYWFDKNDTPRKRNILRVHPRGKKENPLTGVFGCHAAVRPNLIALSVCRILSIEGNVIHLDKIDAFDATPVIDLKPFIPADAPTKDVKVPDWARRR